jgi:hypothetical protein
MATGCTYGHNRLQDAGDIFDWKWACNWESAGVGVKLEVTNYLGAGLGVAFFDDVSETYGRHIVRTPKNEFVHIIVAGVDGPVWEDGSRDGSALYGVGLNCCQDPRPWVIDRFRIGAEIIVLNVDGGLYLNFGQLFDFLAGLTTWDPGDDDGLPRRTVMDWEPEYVR